MGGMGPGGPGPGGGPGQRMPMMGGGMGMMPMNQMGMGGMGYQNRPPMGSMGPSQMMGPSGGMNMGPGPGMPMGGQYMGPGGPRMMGSGMGMGGGPRMMGGPGGGMGGGSGGGMGGPGGMSGVIGPGGGSAGMGMGSPGMMMGSPGGGGMSMGTNMPDGAGGPAPVPTSASGDTGPPAVTPQVGISHSHWDITGSNDGYNIWMEFYVHCGIHLYLRYPALHLSQQPSKASLMSTLQQCAGLDKRQSRRLCRGPRRFSLSSSPSSLLWGRITRRQWLMTRVTKRSRTDCKMFSKALACSSKGCGSAGKSVRLQIKISLDSK